MLGTGDRSMLGWPGRVCALAASHGYDVTCYNLGLRGDTSLTMSRRWQFECESRLIPEVPGVLVFGIGLNDALVDATGDQRIARTATAQAVGDTLKTASGWKPTLLIGPGPVLDGMQAPRPHGGPIWYLSNSSIEATSLVLATAAKNHGVPFLDLFRILSGRSAWSEDLRMSDGVHPSSVGYELVAQTVWSWPQFRALIGGSEVPDQDGGNEPN
jgi:lysophospholipase L1-like esterase